jgi:uncharacterized membrane protein YfcA
MSIAALLLAATIGLVLGALGGGGSMLVVPALVYGLAADPKQAVVMSLPIVALSSVVAAASYWQTGEVELRWSLKFGSFAMIGAFLGAKAGVLLPPAAQLTLLAVVIIVAATSMLRSRPSAHAPQPSSPKRSERSWLAIASAAAIGGLTGLVGIGGGFLLVPVLRLVLGFPMRVAVGTSLVVISMNALAAMVGYIGSVPIPWPVVLMFAATMGSGAVAGAWVGRRMPGIALQQAFAILLLVVAAGMLLDNMPWQEFFSNLERLS